MLNAALYATLSCVLFATSSFSGLEAFAETLEPHAPKICVGYHGTKEEKDWARADAWGETPGENCPENFAFFDSNRTAVRLTRRNKKNRVELWSPGSERPVRASCCPLPATDILTDHIVLAFGSCPKDHVVTGNKINENCPNCKNPFYCTRINTKRYQLGEKQPAMYWGFGSTFWFNRFRFMREDIPAAIRHSIGRLERFLWELQGCVGYPFGALFVGAIEGRSCANFYYRQLQFRGLSGDPPQGTPVKMFPDCDRISDYFNPYPECIVDGTESNVGK